MNSKMTNEVKAQREAETSKAVVNFMAGVSYEINPLDNLKMITASSIFGEPSYYRNGSFGEKKIKDGVYGVHELLVDYSLDSLDKYKGMTTTQIMENAIDDALSYDFKGVLEWAAELRNKYLMRLNPQIIMIRAAFHPNRKDFTDLNPGFFGKIQDKVMSRGDDVISQITYVLYLNKSKNNIPSLLKRSWANKISSLSRYELYKYRNHGIGLINAIRICHANNDDINELMSTGSIVMEENNTTWETLRAGKMPWVEILEKIRMPHMALLRNLRGIFSEIDNSKLAKDLMKQLTDTTLKGKQFPFRYYTASNVINHSTVNNRQIILDGLEGCMDMSCENLPKLSGKNAFLSDNSGSAWGTIPTEYGSVTVAEIGNLSAVIGAFNSDEGYVYTFGDRLLEKSISKRQGVLAQSKEVSEMGRTVGGGTENGVWLFFDKAIKEKIHWDNIFIYSDMQAGHGGLYGTENCIRKYRESGYSYSHRYINVPKLIDAYRREVNPKVNVYCIQTAGYNNVLIPEYTYRGNILYGWTGKELVFADAMNKFWDEKDAQKANK